ncbi:MAG: CTP synthase, partial [Bacteroidales bacterium]|nr:CTP synthase [Bacteroidales bacterium]
PVQIALVGKYIELHDAYKSIVESFEHAGATNEVKVKIKWVVAEKVTPKTADDLLKDVSGILVAPGFGLRGVEGKIEAVKYARENKIPFLGICLGMQCAVIEFARNVLKLQDAHSTEMLPTTPHPVIDIMEEQKSITNMGGTMRLGSYPCKINKNSNVFKAYNQDLIDERHRHRYEFNNAYQEEYEKAGMYATGINPDSNLVEIIEIKNHPWFVGVQFHPEYKSTVLNPHPLFVSFVAAAFKFKQSKKIN